MQDKEERNEAEEPQKIRKTEEENKKWVEERPERVDKTLNIRIINENKQRERK